MHRRDVILRLCAAWLFSAGFVLVGSGWGPALSRMMSSRPTWSVCGQALCQCRPVAVPVEMPADCPLCLAGEPMPGAARACSGVELGSERGVDASRLLIRRTNSEAAMTRLDSAGQLLLVGCFLIGVRTPCDDVMLDTRTRLTLHGWRLPTMAVAEVPTPPPKA